MSIDSYIKAGVVQMVSTFDLDNNFRQAAKLITQAAQKGAKLIVLPENCLMFSSSMFLELTQDLNQQEKIFNFLSNQARNNDCYLVAGSIPVPAQEKAKVFSACIVFSPQGEELARYNKIHLFDVDVDDNIGRYRESDTIQAGEQVVAFDIDGIKVGLAICYDLRFPELFRELSKQGCDVFVLPSAFTYATGDMHWEVLLKARAIENQCFMLAANQGGEHLSAKGGIRKTYGHSMIVGPQGEILASCGMGEDICVTDLDCDFLKQVRKKMPVLNHRRL
jgi:nitrilase